MSSTFESNPWAKPKNADPRLRPTRRGGISLSTLIVAGALSAAVFGSRVVLQEIQSQPDMLGYESFRHAGMVWDRAVRHVGTTVPDAMLHDAVRRVEAARF